MHLSPPPPPPYLRLLFFLRWWFGSVVVGVLLNVLPIVRGSSVFVFFCYALLCAHFNFAIILKRKRNLDVLLFLSYRCIVTECSVAIPHGSVGWSAACDCGIS